MGTENRATSAPSASTPATTTTTVRQSIARTEPSSCSGQRAAMRSATDPQTPPATAARSMRGDTSNGMARSVPARGAGRTGTDGLGGAGSGGVAGRDAGR